MRSTYISARLVHAEEWNGELRWALWPPRPLRSWTRLVIDFLNVGDFVFVWLAGIGWAGASDRGPSSQPGPELTVERNQAVRGSARNPEKAQVRRRTAVRLGNVRSVTSSGRT